MKLWEKKYELDKQIEAFTVGNDYLLDQKLVKYDCLGSIAHAKMLNNIGILSDIECNKLIMTLNEIITINGNGAFVIKQEDEDCHTAIENYLVKKIGDCGKKIHTARSRNDQVLTALRLYYKDEIKAILKLTDEFIKTLSSVTEKHGLVELPGYTHMKKAMPSSVGLWAESFIESMQDNKLLLNHVAELIDQSPLGTGAGYGLTIEVNRELTKELLGFKKIQNNPIYAQNSRGKFESSILHALSQIMFDLNKISSDLILFNMDEFGYFGLPLELSTGSSIMPHKKNPDVLEIARANYHQIIAFEFQVKNIISNLISGYNRDLQLTKKPVVNGFEITKSTLKIIIKVLGQINVNESRCKDAMTKELYAADKAYKLVKQGIAFRDAYKKISQEHERNI